jgi:hypothetical protein
LNNDYGINFPFTNCINNLIYHNFFINNANQVCDNTNSGNQWDNGYPSGGNFWSDYNGVDDYKGPNQDILGSDEIGDTPYDIDGDSRDNYPLLIINDTISPVILLLSPLNNSVIKAGTILDFHIYDAFLHTVNYSVNGSSDISLSDPFNISTSGWAEGDYSIQINTLDSYGNSQSSLYFFTIDSTKPMIYLNTPGNNSVFPSNIFLNFSIIDENINQITYSINGEDAILFSDPYNISTSDWIDRSYTIQINALDLAGNLNVSWYLFTIDSTKPMIQLNSPVNNTIIPSGTLLDFSIVDVNLMISNYSKNFGEYTDFSNPFNILTFGWPDGNYTIHVNTLDHAGNSNSSWYFFIMDSSPPLIILNDPLDNSYIQSGHSLDFTVTDPNLVSTTYSINDGSDLPLSDPFEIPTIDWDDGNYTVQINALDIAGNLTSASFFFIIDSTYPEIILNSPNNNTVIQSGTLLDFWIVDSNIYQVNYSLNDGDYIPFSSPYDIPTNGLEDDDYTIFINALDLAGNINISWYTFTIDSSEPQILLNTPVNNSYCRSGISLDFSIIDSNIKSVDYSVNQETRISFSPPYDISTSGWEDGHYTIHIDALDWAGNSNSSWFLFIIDTTRPSIILKRPGNNTIIQGGTVLDFMVDDPNLSQVDFVINEGVSTSLIYPFDISTNGWMDGDYTVLIHAMDLAGNFNSSMFRFSLDSTPPTIWFDPGLNHSTIVAGTPIYINITAMDSDIVLCSINGGGYQVFEAPYMFHTYKWKEGSHIISIIGKDTAGNQASQWFEVKIDSISPYIISTEPSNNAHDVENITKITIVFSEPMDKELVQDHLSISPHANFSYQWNHDGNLLSISFVKRLDEGTKYKLRIDKEMADANGNTFRDDFELIFTTKGIGTDIDKIPDSKEGQASDVSWIWYLVLALIIVIIVLLLMIREGILGNEDDSKFVGEVPPMIGKSIASKTGEEGVDFEKSEEDKKEPEGEEPGSKEIEEKEGPIDEEVDFTELDQILKGPSYEDVKFKELEKEIEELLDEDVSAWNLEEEGQEPADEEILFEEMDEEGKKPTDDEVTFEEIEKGEGEPPEEEVTFEEIKEDKKKTKKKPELEPPPPPPPPPE